MSETLEQRVVRLLGEAHAIAQAGDVEDALDYAAVAYEDWYSSPVQVPDTRSDKTSG